MVVRVCVASVGWWSTSYDTESPIAALPVAGDGTMFAPWASEDDGWDAKMAPPECAWWNGTYYYDLDMCSHM